MVYNSRLYSEASLRLFCGKYRPSASRLSQTSRPVGVVIVVVLWRIADAEDVPIDPYLIILLYPRKHVFFPTIRNVVICKEHGLNSNRKRTDDRCYSPGFNMQRTWNREGKEGQTRASKRNRKTLIHLNLPVPSCLLAQYHLDLFCFSVHHDVHFVFASISCVLYCSPITHHGDFRLPNKTGGQATQLSVRIKVF